MLLLPFVAKAQESTLRYGYISYKEAVKALPDYEQAQQNMAALKAKYDAEMQRVEDEFNKKYEDFLAGQRDFAPSILRKRQAAYCNKQSKIQTTNSITSSMQQ